MGMAGEEGSVPRRELQPSPQVPPGAWLSAVGFSTCYPKCGCFRGVSLSHGEADISPYSPPQRVPSGSALYWMLLLILSPWGCVCVCARVPVPRE